MVRVDIFLSLPAAGNFVVVDDPIPGGLEPVNRDLATASMIDAAERAGAYRLRQRQPELSEDEALRIVRGGLLAYERRRLQCQIKTSAS